MKGDLTDAGTTNMFIRLREGASEYRNAYLCGNINETNYPGSDSDGKLHMELVGDHRWRAYLRTETNMTERTLSFWFELAGRTEAGATAVGTDVITLCPVEAALTHIPHSGFVEEVDPNAERKTTWQLDGTSSYLMFELDDRSMALTVARAEYQNFNDWTHSLGTKFDGNFVSTTGVSSVKKRFDTTTVFSEATPDATTNASWQELFDMFSSTGEYKYDRYFSKSTTPNGWEAENGLYVREKRAEWYTPEDVASTQTTASVGMSLEMLGSGFGNLAYAGSTNGLDGLRHVKLNARLSQGLEMADFAYYEDGTSLSNYGFTAQAQMSETNGKDMSPVFPSMSLVGYYRPNTGCYEFRATRSSENGMTVALYKWSRQNGALEPELLTNWVTALAGRADISNPRSGAQKSQGPDGTEFRNFLVSTNAYDVAGQRATTMYIACSNVTEILPAGGTNSYTRICCGLAFAAGAANASGKKYLELQYNDNTNRYTRGTYGLGMNDCRGAFMAPAFGTELTPTGTVVMTSVQREDDLGLKHLYADASANSWSVPIGRMAVTNFQGALYPSIVSDVRDQPLALEIASQTGSSQVWTEVARTNVTSFGNTAFVFDQRRRGRYYVRLRHAAEYSDPRTDITVDDIILESWRALDSASIATSGGFRDWVYTQGWITDGTVRLVPRRADPAKPSGLRSPLLDGLSLFSFTYKNASSNCVLRLQVCTNGVDGPLTEYNRVLENLTYGSTAFATNWVDVQRWTFAEGESGTRYHVFSGYRAPKNTAVRLILEPALVTGAETDYSCEIAGITITSATVLDEPALDPFSWRGWNMLTTTNTLYSYLPDPSIRHFPGMSAVLNNSLTDDLKNTEDLAHYEYENPYVETPASTNGLGYVMFKARKYDTTNDTPAYVTIYGSKSGGETDGDWTALDDIEVSNKTFRQYTWRLQGTDSEYKALRLAVKGLKKEGAAFAEEPVTNPVQRVVLDEVSVSEVMAPKLVFVSAMPFRTPLTTDEIVANLDDTAQQPLTGESFGFQCELKVGQLADELDMDSIYVEMYYYPGTSPWGFKNWNGKEGSIRCIMPVVSNLTFRSSYSTRASIVPPQPAPSNPAYPRVVQYCMVAHWKDKSENTYELELGSGQWVQPKWYYPLNLNKQYGKGDSAAFSPYTILENLSPRRAWINCVNLFDTDNDKEVSAPTSRTNQFVELAVPAGVDMTGWAVRARATPTDAAWLFILGSGGVPAMKAVGATNLYSFLTVQSPQRASAGGSADGTWNKVNVSRNNNRLVDNGAIKHNYAIGLELIRPSGIVEHQITVDNAYTDFWLYRYPMEGAEYLATNLLAEAGSSWVFAGSDKEGSLGVMSSHGEDSGTWEADLLHTPMAVNRRKDGTLQSINPDKRYFIPPNGTNYWVTLTVAGDHLVQDIDGNTNAVQVLIIPGGSGTNIVYTAEKYYMISSLTTNDAPVDLSAVSPARVYTFKLEDVKSNMDITARADVSSAIAGMFDADVDADKPYKPYVMKWLQDEYGAYDPEDVKLAGYYDLSGTNLVRYLTLTEMYQLGINPVQECRFVAGIGDPDDRTGRSSWPRVTTRGGEPVTNIEVSVFMMITNTVTGEAYPPFVLNGLGQNSRDFTSSGKWDSTAWTSVTFKVACRLAKSAGDGTPKWVPLRWYFFDENSFGAADSANPFRARIEVADPFKPWSPAASEGYTPAMEGSTLFFRWQIDHVRRPDSIDLLRTNSTINATSD